MRRDAIRCSRRSCPGEQHQAGHGRTRIEGRARQTVPQGDHGNSIGDDPAIKRKQQQDHAKWATTKFKSARGRWAGERGRGWLNGINYLRP